MTSQIVYGRYLITDAATVIPDGAVCIEDGQVIACGPYSSLIRQYPATASYGSDQFLITPGFVNAHGHGRGLTDFQLGTLDDTLETWKFRSYPAFSLYYDTLWRSVLLLESGVTTTMHNHNLAQPGEAVAEFRTAIGAYLDSGIRVAFAPSLVNRNPFVYGDNAAFVDSLPPDLQTMAREYADRAARFGAEEYFAAVTELRREFNSERVRIMHGPVSPQWCTDEAMIRVKDDANQNGMLIHTHVLQTWLQKQYGQRQYGKSLLGHLDDLGFLGPNVTCGHCVWLTEADIELLAATGTSVTHHASCNLRIRNGISPVFALRQKGVRVGLGIDDKGFSDGKDLLEEMRLVSKLHRLPSHRLDSPHLLPADCFRMGTAEGAATLGYGELTGSLVPGKQADLVIFDLSRITEPYLYPGHSIIDALIYRGRNSDIHRVMVGGEVVVQDGKYTRHDRAGIIRRLQESLPADYAAEFARRKTGLDGLRRHIAAYYDSGDWYQPDPGAAPYYRVNSKE